MPGLRELTLTAAEQRQEAALRAGRMSIQGVQAKLSARLNIKDGSFDIVDTGGTFILKPPSDIYPELPQNEDLTMRLAAAVGIEIPLHGLVYAKDGSMTYFIRRFDRVGRDRRLAVEDFAQLSGKTRDTKYDSSMEHVATRLDFCTYPLVERRELFRRVIFCFLTGNEDMHLKNFSLLTRNSRIMLAPAYDLLCSSIVLRDPVEIALPLRGKQRNLTRNDLIRYFGEQRLELPPKTIDLVLRDFEGARPRWDDYVERSFLSAAMKEKYSRVIADRWDRIFADSSGRRA